MKKILCVLAVAAIASGCASVSYRPVQETSFEQLARQGCVRSGDRFSTTALVSSATRETIVLTDGGSSQQTVAVTLPAAGFGSKVKGAFGKNRYELGYERLNELRVSRTPLNFTMRCEAAQMAPVADRFSYIDAGNRVEFEF